MNDQAFFVKVSWEEHNAFLDKDLLVAVHVEVRMTIGLIFFNIESVQIQVAAW